MTYQAAFAEQLKNNAWWRREKAAEYPEDAQRNIDAAELSEDLAAQFTADDFDVRMMAKIVDLGQDEDQTFYLSEATSEIISRIGFGEFPQSPDDLLDSILRRFAE